MTSSYENIYSRFLGKITDYEFANLQAGDAYESMHDWLHSTVADPFVRKLFSSISFDDEIMAFTFVLNNSFDDDFDKEFVEEMFARSMVIYWLEPKVKSTPNLDFMVAGKETKFYSQSNHLTTLREMLRKEKSNFQKYVRNYGYAHYSLNGDQ